MCATSLCCPVWKSNVSDLDSTAGAAQGQLEITPSEYPVVRRDDILETLHGVQVADPYRCASCQEIATYPL